MNRYELMSRAIRVLKRDDRVKTVVESIGIIENIEEGSFMYIVAFKDNADLFESIRAFDKIGKAMLGILDENDPIWNISIRTIGGGS